MKVDLDNDDDLGLSMICSTGTLTCNSLLWIRFHEHNYYRDHKYRLPTAEMNHLHSILLFLTNTNDNLVSIRKLTSPRPSPSPKTKAPKSPKKGKRNLASGLVTKI